MTIHYISEWQAEPPPPEVRCLCFEVEAPEALSTIAIAHGLRVEDGTVVRWAGDWRPMLEVARAIRDTGKPVECIVPSWALL